MKKYLEILKNCPLFFGIGDEDLLRMLTCLGARVDSFDKKYTILGEGSPATYIGIVLSGSVQVIQMDYYGNRSILGNLAQGQVFAEEFACAEIASLPVSVIANEPCEIMLIQARHIMQTCENHCGFHRQLIFNLMKDMAEKTILFHRKMEITSKRSTREKLMTYLMQTAKETGSDTFRIPFDRQELADYLEVDRSGLSSEIGKLKKEGFLETEKNLFRLL